MLDLHLELDPALGRRAALENGLRTAIRSGRLAAGTRLPSSRALALDVGVSRATVVEAFEQLIAEGYLVARRGSGTHVAAVREAATSDGPLLAPVPAWAADFRPGEPDVATFPRREWVTATRAVLASTADGMLSYGDPRGLPELRSALASFLARSRAVDADAERVFVFSGFGQAVGSATEVLRRLGVGVVAVEEPCLPPHRLFVERAGVQVVPVPVDAEGLCVEALSRSGAGAVVVTPAHQYPLGTTLGADRRSALVAWARASATWVVEDDYDGEFRYDRQPVGSLQGLAPDQVIYAGTASKILAPGVALGWLVVPPELVAPLAESERWRMTASTIQQATLARFVATGGLDRHLRAMRLLYRARRNAVVDVLQGVAPEAKILGVAAGLHVTVELASPEHERGVLRLAAAASVGLLGLGAHHTGPPTRSGIVVGYSRPASHAFPAALRRLHAVMEEAASAGLLAPSSPGSATPGAAGAGGSTGGGRGDDLEHR